MKPLPKKFRAFWVSIAVLVIVFSLGLAWLQKGLPGSVTEKIYAALPLPAALVNGQVVTTRQYMLRLQLAKKFALENGISTSPNLGHSVFERLLDETKLYVLARDKNVLPAQSQIDSEYNLTQVENTADPPYGLDEKTYKNELVRANVTAANLKIWFFGQKQFNPQSYGLAEEIMQKLNAGEPMPELVKAYSEDAQSKSLDGDAGFLEITGILPEMREPMETMAVGDSKIIPTRFGLEVIRLENVDTDSQNRPISYHIRHIFLAGGNFGEWLRLQTKNYNITNIAHF